MDSECIESLIETVGRDIIGRKQVAEQEQGRKSEALSEEMMRHHAQIFYLCLGFCKNAADAEDLTHDVYLKALEKSAFLRDTDKLKIWLFRIARNLCLNHVRRGRFIRLFFRDYSLPRAEEGDPEIRMLQAEQIRRLKEALSRLPQRQREVFILREYGDLSYREIAETMRIKEGTVMSALNSARKKVIRYLQGEKPHGTKRQS